jgi:hypothetical protein
MIETFKFNSDTNSHSVVMTYKCEKTRERCVLGKFLEFSEEVEDEC